MTFAARPSPLCSQLISIMDGGSFDLRGRRPGGQQGDDRGGQQADGGDDDGSSQTGQA
jgi:hypothetical protein